MILAYVVDVIDAAYFLLVDLKRPLTMLKILTAMNVTRFLNTWLKVLTL